MDWRREKRRRPPVNRSNRCTATRSGSPSSRRSRDCAQFHTTRPCGVAGRPCGLLTSRISAVRAIIGIFKDASPAGSSPGSTSGWNHAGWGTDNSWPGHNFMPAGMGESPAAAAKYSIPSAGTIPRSTVRCGEMPSIVGGRHVTTVCYVRDMFCSRSVAAAMSVSVAVSPTRTNCSPAGP